MIDIEKREAAWDAYSQQSIEFTISEAFNAGYTAASAEREWQTTKPDYACVFVGKYGDDYSLWSFVWKRGEAPDDFEGNEETIHYYLAWTDKDGDEWDDYDECEFDEYLVIATLPTMDEVHADTIERIRRRYEKELDVTKGE